MTRPSLRGFAALTIALSSLVLWAGGFSMTAQASAPSPQAPAKCHTTAQSDFDGNGRSDLAVGAPGANEVEVFNGTSNGLTPGPLFQPGVDGIPAQQAPAEAFGSIVGAGDINGDGCADLAIREGSTLNFGAPGESGEIVVLSGSPGTGLTTSGVQVVTVPELSVYTAACGLSPYNCRFGDAMAVADVNGDGFADLLVAYYNSADNGRLLVIPGSATGLQPSHAIVHVIGTNSETGQNGIDNISTGDINGDGISDVAVGFDQNCDACDSHQTHGPPGVAVLFGARHGLGTGLHRELWRRSTPGVPGSDIKQATVTTVLGDFNGDGHDDLAFAEGGLPPVTILYGTKHGLSTAHTQARRVKAFVLAAGDFNHDGDDELVAGNGGTGQNIWVFPGTRKNGLTKTGVLHWTQSTPGIPGADVRNDAWGLSLATGNYGHGLSADLAVGAPDIGQPSQIGQSFGPKGGTVTVLYGSTTRNVGLRTTYAQVLTSSTGTASFPTGTGDNFGFTLSSSTGCPETVDGWC